MVQWYSTLGSHHGPTILPQCIRADKYLPALTCHIFSLCATQKVVFYFNTSGF